MKKAVIITITLLVLVNLMISGSAAAVGLSWKLTDTGMSRGEVMQSEGWHPLAAYDDQTPRWVFNAGFSSQVLWLRLASGEEADLQLSGQRYLVLDNPLLDDIQVYLRSDQGWRKRWQTGDSMPFHSRPVSSRFFVFPLDADTTDEVLVRVSTSSSLKTEINYLDEAQWRTLQIKDRVLSAVFYTAIAIFLVYNLFLYLSTRDAGFLYYALYMGSIMFSTLAVSGLAFEFLWPDSPAFANTSIPLLLNLNILFASLFIMQFLPAKVMGRRFRRFWLVICALSLIQAAAALYIPYTLSIYLFTALALVAVSGLVINGALAYWRGYKAARFFLLAMFTFLTMGAVRLMLSYGLVPLNDFTRWSSQSGLILEALLLSLALADRINTLKKEKETAQSLSIANLHKADELKDQFLATATHELRTPLNGLLGFNRALLDGVYGSLNTEQKNVLAMIETSGRRLLNLVNDILDFNVYRSGQLRIHPETVNAAAEIQECVRLLQPLLGNRQLDIKLHLHSQVIQVQYDVGKLQQVLFNIIGNAIKFTDRGQIDITSCVVDDVIEISVTDSGPGIPQELMDRLFEPMTTGQGANSGAGLGLSISREIIQLHGGDIHIQNMPEGGVRVHFTLPAVKHAANDESPVEQEIRDDITAEQLTHQPEGDCAGKVLVVDDDAVNLRVVMSALAKQDYHVITAMSAEAALETVQQEPPDLILLDVAMPGMNGIELCEQLRRQYDFLELPIVMLTARVREQDIINAFEVGCNDYITKPFIPGELCSRVNAYMNSKMLVSKLQENRALIAENKIRLMTERQLLNTQDILSRLIDISSDCILTFDQSGEILFINPAARQLTDVQSEKAHIREVSLDLGAIANMNEKQRLATRGRIARQIQLVNGKQVFVSVKIECIDEEYIFNTVLHNIAGHRLSDMQHSAHIDAINAAFNAIGERIVHQSGVGQPVEPLQCHSQDNVESMAEFRAIIVESMQVCLEIWKQQSHKTKIDLAEQSTLWTVYIDCSTVVTRTLDKYLSVSTLPKNPRWRRVLHTLEYVMAHITDDEAKETLEMYRERLIEASP